MLAADVTRPAAAPATLAVVAVLASAVHAALPFTGGESGLLAVLAGGLITMGAGFGLFGGRRRLRMRR